LNEKSFLNTQQTLPTQILLIEITSEGQKSYKFRERKMVEK